MLEDLGWNVHRVWSRDWVANPEREIQLVLEAVARFAGRKGPDVSPEPPKPSRDEPAKGTTADSSAAPAARPEVPQHISGQNLAEGVVHYELGLLPLEAASRGYHQGSVASDVKKVVDAFGPLERNVVVRHITACWGFQRTGKNIRGTIESGIGLALRQGKVRTSTDGRFLWPTTLREVKPRVPFGYESPRDIDEVCPEELAAAIDLCVQKAGGGISRADLVGLVVRLFGHQRATERLAGPVETVLDTQLAKGRLVSTNETIHVAHANGR